MRTAHALALALVAALLVVIAPGASPAAADQHHRLTGNFDDIAVDEANGHLFLTRGPGTDGVIVTDLAGNVVSTLTGLAGASGMVFSEDRSELYVALADDVAIGIIDTTTLAVDVRALPSSLGTTSDGTRKLCPLNLAVLDGNVWMTDCFGGIASYRPTTRRTTSHGVGGPTILIDHAAHRLYTTSLYTITAYDVSGVLAPSLTQHATVDHTAQTGDCGTQAALNEMALVPGTNLIVGTNGVHLDRDDLSFQGRYPCLHWDQALDSVAVRDDGMAAHTEARPGPEFESFSELTIVRAGTSAPFRSYKFRASFSKGHVIHGLRHATEWGAKKLYVLAWTSSSEDDRAFLRVITPRPASVLRIRTRFERYGAGDIVRVRVRFRGGPNPPRRVLMMHEANDFVRRWIDLEADGRGTFRFRWRARWAFRTRIVDARINDGGDLVWANRLLLEDRRSRDQIGAP